MRTEIAPTKPETEKCTLITSYYQSATPGRHLLAWPVQLETNQNKGANGAPNEESIMKNFLHHNLNALHVYCRLVRVMPKRQAWGITSFWEKTRLYTLMYA